MERYERGSNFEMMWALEHLSEYDTLVSLSEFRETRPPRLQPLNFELLTARVCDPHVRISPLPPSHARPVSTPQYP